MTMSTLHKSKSSALCTHLTLDTYHGLDCDPNDDAGCEDGLACGVNNCGKFHEISAATGILRSSDCCERK